MIQGYLCDIDTIFIVIVFIMLGTEVVSNDTLARHCDDGDEISCGKEMPKEAFNFTHMTT